MTRLVRVARLNSWLRPAVLAVGAALAVLALAAASLQALFGDGSLVSGMLIGLGLAALLFLLGVWRSAPLAATSRWRAGAMAAVLGIVELAIGAALLAGIVGVAVLFTPDAPVWERDQYRTAFDFVVLACVGLGVLVAARGWRRAWREAHLQAQVRLEAERAASALAQKEKELALSELSLLRAQVEPHFLWNTLAGVQYLTRKDPAAAERMTGHLIAYLKACVPSARRGVATVDSEVESARQYLALLQMRMGPRLTVEMRVCDECRGFELPPLLLGTLVENAIKHGLEPKAGPVRLTIEVACDGPREPLRVMVEDDGVGLQALPATRGTGIGLSNVRSRLRALYGDDASASLCGRHGGGAIATLALPARAPAAA